MIKDAPLPTDRQVFVIQMDITKQENKESHAHQEYVQSRAMTQNRGPGPTKKQKAHLEASGQSLSV